MASEVITVKLEESRSKTNDITLNVEEASKALMKIDKEP